MRVIIGYGNELRGEDAFGIDVIKKLEKHSLKNTKLISTMQLTPELCLELLEAKELIFIDACYCSMHQYKLGCSIEAISNQTLSHHINPKVVVSMLNQLYNCNPNYKIYSMFTDSFEEVWNKKKYEECINELSHLLKS